MSKIVVEKLDEVFLKIHCNLETSLELKEHFSCKVPNYYFNPRYKAGYWDGTISFFNRKEQTIPIGLMPMLYKFAENFRYNIQADFDTSTMVNDITEEDLQNFYKIIFKNSSYFPRDYQATSIYKAIRRKRGIIESATASGKSLVIYTLIRFLLGSTDKPILIIVPNIGLVNQMFNDFIDYGWDSCQNYVSVLYHGKRPDFSKNVLVSTWQSIYKKPESFFEKYGSVIVDETHSAKSMSIQSVLKKCVNAEYRIGMTGTLPTEKSDIFTIYGYLGPKIYQVRSKELIDKGVLSKIKIANLILKYPKDFVERNKKRPYPEEIREINGYADRNKAIKYIVDHVSKKENILILCQRINHLGSIYDYLTENTDRKIHKIYGLTAADERETIRGLMEKESGSILLASFGTTSTGINIKKLHHVIFASSYKSKIKVLQSLGRGLRKHQSKRKLILWDIVDKMCWVKRTGNIGENFVYKHWKQRMKYYKNQGFSFINKEISLDSL